MNVLFRVDASTRIGTGHLMRCLTLADVLRERGASVAFACRGDEGSLLDWVRSGRDYPVVEVSAGFDDAPTLDALPGLGVAHVDWLIVDHYGLDARFESIARHFARHILVIDDVADRPHDADLLLDQNYYPDADTRYDDLVTENCCQLLGPKFALLRPEFLATRTDSLANTSIVDSSDLEASVSPESQTRPHLLLTFGGSDPANMTLRVLQALAELPELLVESTFTVEAIVGGSNPHRQALNEFAKTHAWVTLSLNVQDMARRMARATACMGAGGTSIWERLAVGLPSVVVSIAENQVAVAQAVDAAGAHWYLGPTEAMTPKRLQAAAQKILTDAEMRRQFAAAGRAMVDGYGAPRVAAALLGDSMFVRPALPVESVDLYRWRNDEAVRQFSHHPEEIAWETHERWFASTMANPDRLLLIGERVAVPQGVLRYDVEGNEAVVSIYRVPGSLGKGVGTALLKAGTAYLQAHRPDVRRILADIRPENIASVRAFEKAGYSPISTDTLVQTPPNPTEADSQQELLRYEYYP